MISIVICSIDQARFKNATAQWQQAMGSEPFELIGIHDAKSMCEGYNRGLAQSKGDTLIFCHDDIEIWSPDFIPRLKLHLNSFDIVGVAGTNRLIGPGWARAGPPHTFGQVAHKLQNFYRIMIFGASRRIVPGIHAMDGLFLAFRRPAIEQIGWDAEHFTDFHCYDTDCTFRAYRAGLKLGVALDLPLLHLSGGDFGPAWQQHANVFLKLHGPHLSTLPPRQFQLASVDVLTPEDGMNMMKTLYESLPD